LKVLSAAQDSFNERDVHTLQLMAGVLDAAVSHNTEFEVRKEVETELKSARDAALESARLKSQFLANMSHEIRTPMNGVIGMTGVLLDTKLDAEQKDYVDVIQSSADSLLRIIDDILDFSKIEAGQLKFEMIDFDLNEAVEGAIEQLSERARVKGIELASLVYSEVPTAIISDPGRLRQILTNLIGNAIKFTEQGEVAVTVKKESESERYVGLKFEITDTGIGIPEAARRKLFQAFVQADGSTTRKYGGTGLGLAISKQLVEKLGGEIGVESEPGKGSTFWFTAHFEKQTAPAIAPVQAEAGTSLKGVRVLIVDDNATNRRIFVHQTASWGMVPTEAESGARALEIMLDAAERLETFDVAILDLMMPEIDGFELARYIKENPLISKTKIVLMPSFGQRGHGQMARDLGISGYLQKPVRQSQLKSCLSAVIAEESVAAELQQPKRLITQHTLGREKIEPQKTVNGTAREICILVAEDNTVNQKVALKQLHRLGYKADIVTNGREAVEAVKIKRYDLVLMDCQMPEMDGFEATAEIRAAEKDKAEHTRIIAMTAHALKGEREKCLAAGMDDYLSKPVKIEILSQMLEKYLVQSKVKSDVQFEISDAQSVLDTEKGKFVDRAMLDSFRDLQQPGEPDIVTELIDLYLADAAKRITTLRQAAGSGDLKTIKYQAHAVKGGSSNIGALGLARLSSQLEENGIEMAGALATISKMEAEFEKVTLQLNTMRQGVSYKKA
jgi:signal transduction histidine kinase/DNA-binding response OmpR family regulator